MMVSNVVRAAHPIRIHRTPLGLRRRIATAFWVFYEVFATLGGPAYSDRAMAA